MAEKQKYFVDDNLISLLEDLPDDDKEKSLGLLHQLNLSNEHYLVGLTSLQPQTSPQEIDPVKNVVSYLPSGLDIAGFYSTSTQIKPLDIIEECKKCLADNDIKKAFGSSTILLLTLVSERPTLYSYNSVTEELTQLPLTSRDDSILDSCILGRLSCTLRIGLEYKSKTFKNDLYKEIEVQKDTIRSSATAFRVSDSNILLFSECNSKLNCQELLNHIEKDDEDEFDRKKKQKNVDFGKVVVHFELLAQSTGDDALENTISCAPVIRHDHGSFQQLDLQLPVDVVVYLHPDTLVRSLHHTLVTALCRQIDAMYRCLIANNQNGTFHTPVPFHMKPSKLSHLVTVVYPDGISEDDLESTRKGIHRLFLLPKTSPFFRRQNLYVFSDEKLPGGYLVNPHLSVSSANAKGCISTVQGRYTYHHYMQDRTDDNKWGCAYRSLQTLVSWFKLQGYTDKSVPTHKEIQKILVDIGDKEPKFIGSRQWIGSTEVSYVLDDLLGVSSKILFVSNGAELASKGRELANHFNEIGTPIMIGGGVLAHTILGVDFNEITGHIRFLILDPHYTGGEDIKIITDKGWCGWKGPDFWDQNAYYNLCMPQRPNMI